MDNDIGHIEIIANFFGDIISRIGNQYFLALLVLSLVLALLALMMFGKSVVAKIRLAAFVVVAVFFSGVSFAMYFVSMPAKETQEMPAIPVAEPANEMERLEIQASQLVSGTNVAVGPLPNLYGPNVLMNAPPFNARGNSATYELNAKGGEYELRVRYAAAAARPLDILLDGVVVLPNALNKPTGGWLPQDQRWEIAGNIELVPGPNTIEFRSSDVFPHITEFELIQVK